MVTNETKNLAQQLGKFEMNSSLAGAAIREIRNEFVSGRRSKFVKLVKFVV